MFLHSPPAAQNVSYLFVDGECLNCVLDKIGDRYFGKVRPLLDWSRVRGVHRKVFYYDAIPVQKPGEDDNTHSTRVAPKRRELAEIERQPGYHVRTGEAHSRRRRGNEQKMVDVQLAVNALLMANRGLFASCTLLTGDLDFGAAEGSFLHRMLARKPRMLVAIALANKMARAIWAMLTKDEDYRVPAAATP